MYFTKRWMFILIAYISTFTLFHHSMCLLKCKQKETDPNWGINQVHLGTQGQQSWRRLTWSVLVWTTWSQPMIGHKCNWWPMRLNEWWLNESHRLRTTLLCLWKLNKLIHWTLHFWRLNLYLFPTSRFI